MILIRFEGGPNDPKDNFEVMFEEYRIEATDEDAEVVVFGNVDALVREVLKHRAFKFQQGLAEAANRRN